MTATPTRRMRMRKGFPKKSHVQSKPSQDAKNRAIHKDFRKLVKSFGVDLIPRTSRAWAAGQIMKRAAKLPR